MFQYEAKLIRVVDGDTVWLDVDLGFRLRMEVVCRLANINAPEKVNFVLGGVRDKAAEHMCQVLGAGQSFVVDVTKPEKYGRWLVTIRYLEGGASRAEILARGINLNDELVRLGYAKRYKI